MNKDAKYVIIADCLPGYHHPLDDPSICIPNGPLVNEAEPIPTLNEYGTLFLCILIFGIALITSRKH